MSARLGRWAALTAALVLLTPSVAFAHGGLYAGADNVATVLVAADLAVIAWYRRLRRKARDGAGRLAARRWVLLPVAVALPVAAVTTTSWVPKNTPSRQRPMSTAQLRIVTPTPGEVVGRSFAVQLDLRGGRIVSLTTTRNRPNQGHIHVSVDGALQSMTSGLRQELHDLSPGRHVVQAEFVAADHGPFKAPVVASVTVEVRA
ncbi:MAG: hypothetical protein JOY57_12365 [Actinobacteria bacterium]|nr:hypothetical protein [Actinomycetota bacterium]